jgi:hypothetical protein
LTNGNYFTATGGGGTALNAGDAITSTQTIYVYSAGTGSCPDAENSFVVTINDTPLADAPADVDAALSYSSLLADFLTDLLLQRRLNAREFCTIMYYAGKSGVPDVAKYGYRPDASSGHFQRHLKATLGYVADNGATYSFSLPGHTKSLERSLITFTGLPAQEQVAADYDANAIQKIQTARRNRTLPPCYWSHPVVVHNPDEDVAAFGFYLDGVAYSNYDSTVGLWVTNLLTERHYLLGQIRKRRYCDCGCKGWCTKFSIFAWVNWSFESLASGKFPTARHDGALWLPSDSQRAALADTPLGVRIAILWIASDWAECSTLGLPTWQDSLRPCPMCNGDGDVLCGACDAELHLDALPFRENDEADYYTACDVCEIQVPRSI